MIKQRIKNGLTKLWYFYMGACMFVGSFTLTAVLLYGMTFTIGLREFKWEGIFHYTIEPIIEWFWKV